MFKFQTDQRHISIGGMSVGGQPGRRRTMMIGSVFYPRHTVVLDPREGRIDRERLRERLDAYLRTTQGCGCPTGLMIYAESGKAARAYLEEVADRVPGPLFADSGSSEVRLSFLKHAEEMGLRDRLVYNTVNAGLADREMEALRERPPVNAVVLAFNRVIGYAAIHGAQVAAGTIIVTALMEGDATASAGALTAGGVAVGANVAVAIDPEFSAAPGQETPPGRPIGTVKASQINKVQRMLDDYTRERRLPTRKILIVHQFGDANVGDGVPPMIRDKKSLETFDNVELVFDADGLGGQAVKMVKYNKMTDAAVYPFTRFRGIKIFFPNPWEKHGHYDKPPMNLDQIFGVQPAEGGKVRIANRPDVVIIA